MALTNCPQCDGQVSTDALICPNCGHSLTGAIPQSQSMRQGDPAEVNKDEYLLEVWQGATLTAFGVAIGLAAAAAVTRGLTSLLFGVTSLDPVTYAGVTVLLAGVAAAACTVPAWRAASVDPAIALRTE